VCDLNDWNRGSSCRGASEAPKRVSAFVAEEIQVADVIEAVAQMLVRHHSISGNFKNIEGTICSYLPSTPTATGVIPSWPEWLGPRPAAQTQHSRKGFVGHPFQ
jgi:hypothetical protein